MKPYTIVANVSPSLQYDTEEEAVKEAQARAEQFKDIEFTVCATGFSVKVASPPAPKRRI